MLLIFPNLCLWRRSFRSNVGGIHAKKLYRATLRKLKLKFPPKALSWQRSVIFSARYGYIIRQPPSFAALRVIL